MRRLDFLDPKFKTGLNFTVRKGEKWADLGIGEQIELALTGKAEHFYEAFVEIVIVTRLGDVPQLVFQNEHSPLCHTPTGLHRALIAAYGNTIDVDTVVTCVGFKILDR